MTTDTRGPTGLPFDDIRNVVRGMPGADSAAVDKVRAREAELIKPAGSLGRLEEIAEWLAAWQGTHPPKVLQPQVCVFAGTHGVAARGVSPLDPALTQQMVFAHAAGGAAVNQMAAAAEAGLKVFDLALDVPTGDICVEAAMDERTCAGTIAFGMEAVAQGGDLLCIGDWGVANGTPAAALACALHGGAPEAWAQREPGQDDAGYARKLEAVVQALDTHAGHLADPLNALARLGGRELAAIAGAIVAARYQRMPVLLDGFVTCVAASVLQKIRPDALDHCMVAHLMPGSAHARLLEAMGKAPLIDLGITLPEGAGAALAIPLVRAAAAAHAGMATYEQAEVTRP
ncbi:nicotinate-nucleotide--dimethylbenzimidazole phosphoribosyltransferase [Futiania mangrovi]|uniref:Nicotinate-nucleotide--dimethylbenzimidazole phosphoribosyltransferase n=1 Tax=Futiania mangrovi TaxID=2959716 RepID=A0A9J6PC81_9PROT|nr:nicotinate-nucleotide--dimethylbenzimidazole phosphoribosyltransferase [Futiania mangrovii]MCP1335854.1 nicotinate-nucleotide--dimethylbenzimidazole phosphoribosyltransferase [Futiania mangrovii]